jgi:hypothetical protein
MLGGGVVAAEVVVGPFDVVVRVHPDPIPQMLAVERLVGDDQVPFHGHLLTLRLSGILLLPVPRL